MGRCCAVFASTLGRLSALGCSELHQLPAAKLACVLIVLQYQNYPSVTSIVCVGGLLSWRCPRSKKS